MRCFSNQAVVFSAHRRKKNHRGRNVGWREAISFFTFNKVNISHALNICLLSSDLNESMAIVTGPTQRQRTKAQRSRTYPECLSKTTMSVEVLEERERKKKKVRASLQLFHKSSRWKVCPCPGIRSKRGKYLPNLSIWPSSYPWHAPACLRAIWKCWWEQSSGFSLANWKEDWRGLSRLRGRPKRHARWKTRRLFPWPHSVTCLA